MMDDDMLSQDEIDALLSMNDESEDEQAEEKDKAQPIKNEDYLSSIEEDTIGEIGNISFGNSATTLSTLLNQKVSITTPQVSIVRKQELNKAFSFEHVKVQVNYESGFTGENLFVIKSEDAAIISDIMLGGDGTSPDDALNDIHLSAVQEAMNQMMGAAATSMSTIFNKLVNITPPTIELGEAYKTDATIENLEDELFVKVSFQLKVGDLIDSNIMQLIPFPFAYELVEELLNQSSKEKQEVNKEPAQPDMSDKVDQNQMTGSEKTQNEDVKQQYLGEQTKQADANIQTASFSEFDKVELNKNEQRNLDMLLDIPLQVTVELGRTQKPIKDILDLSSGSIIELDKLAGEPVDILVNKKLIAQGEVVVIDENFGVRVTDIISKTERLMKLN